jgi:hypothetical protein
MATDNQFDPDLHIPAAVHMRTTWIFEVDKRDALLILKGLSGGLLTNVDREEAKRLGERLTELRALNAQQNLRGLDRAIGYYKGTRISQEAA